MRHVEQPTLPGDDPLRAVLQRFQRHRERCIGHHWHPFGVPRSMLPLRSVHQQPGLVQEEIPRLGPETTALSLAEPEVLPGLTLLALPLLEGDHLGELGVLPLSMEQFLPEVGPPKSFSPKYLLQRVRLRFAHLPCLRVLGHQLTNV